MRPGAIAVAAAVMCGAGCSGACGTDETVSGTKPTDGGQEANAGGTGGSVGGTGGTLTDGSGASPCAPPPKPDIVPAGWDAFTDYSCEQPFYVPSSEQYFPEPILWEPCPPPAKLSSGCQWMKVTWDDPSALQVAHFSPSKSGQPLLSFMRIVRPDGGVGHAYSLVATASGSIRFALLNPRTPQEGTSAVLADLNEDRFAIEVSGGEGYKKSAFDSNRRGMLLGKLGNLRPELFQVEVTPSVYSWVTGSKLAVRAEAPAQRLMAFPIDGAPGFELASVTSDPDGLVPDLPILLGDSAVFTMESLLSQGIMAYDPVQQTHPLIRWYGDTTKGAYNVGTDGNDLVWTLGEDHPSTGGSYSKRSIWTSPFSTDPSKLVPKRLRSDPETAFDVNFAVGCGHAAHKLQPSDGLLLVRLKDGISWILPNTVDAPDKTMWVWTKAIGVTCEDVFGIAAVTATTGAKPVYTVARVRIDSLGPGVPPD